MAVVVQTPDFDLLTAQSKGIDKEHRTAQEISEQIGQHEK
jgi:hypothetical protein